MVFQEDIEPQQQEESGPYEEVYKDSSTFLKVDLNTNIYDSHNNYMLARICVDHHEIEHFHFSYGKLQYLQLFYNC